MSKYARTTITKSDDRITPARINLDTGQIKPHPYKTAQNKYIKATPKKGSIREIDYSLPGDLLGYTPHWVVHTILDKSVKDCTKQGKQIRKNKVNDNNVFLTEFLQLSDAVQEIPVLDNLITGVTSLDCGNKKPISKGLLFSMLRDLEEINSVTIKQYTGYSENYSNRLAQYLTVLSKAFDAEVDKNL